MRQLKIAKQVTNRESKSLDKYLQDISKIDLITETNHTDTRQISCQQCKTVVEKIYSVLQKDQRSERIRNENNGKNPRA